MYYFLTYSMMFLHMFVGLILIGIILLQRGRGGGLAGAFGGMGGQSAFGTKAGDVFTKITIWLATAWIVLGCVCVLLASNSRTKSAKIQEFAAEVKEAPEDKAAAGDKSAGEKKSDDAAIPPGPGPSKPPGTKAEEPADKDVKPDAAVDPKKSEEKAEDVKKDAKPEATEDDAKKEATPEVKEDVQKPAEPAKKAEGEAAAEKASTEKPE